MKKIYLTICALVVSLGASAQIHQIIQEPNLERAKNEVQNLPKAQGQVFYHDNFDSTMVGIGLTTSLGSSMWTFDNDGQAGGEFGWSIDAISNGWWSAPSAIASASEGSYAELSNGDPTNPASAGGPTQVLDVTYTMTTTNPIDIQTLAGTDNVTLSFQQYGARYYDLQQILISTNGTTWVPVGDNLDKPIFSGTSGSAYPNPNLKEINLFPFIEGNATSVWVRFLWTINFSEYEEYASAWLTYGWYIDDLKLSTNADNELSLEEVFIGDFELDLNYTQVPSAQTAPMMVGLSLENNGVADHVSQPVAISVKRNGTEVYTETINITLASGEADTVWQALAYTPTMLGVYDVDVTLPTDDITSNNTGTNSIMTTEYIYAHDDGVITPRGFANQAGIIRIANSFIMVTTQAVSAVNVKFAGGTNVSSGGQQVKVRIDELDANENFIYVTETFHTITSANLAASSTVVKFDAPAILQAGKYYVVFVEKLNVDAAVGLFIAGSDGNNDNSTFCYADFGDGAGWYSGWSWEPHIRLNFDPSLAVENLSMLDNVRIYPNPSRGNVTITNDNATENTISIFDISGKLMTSKTTTHAETLDLSQYGAGVYVVEISNENNKKTERVVIN